MGLTALSASASAATALPIQGPRDAAFVDTFREFQKGPGHYTWWSLMADCRARNIGWRVDYFTASEKLRPALKRAWISPEVRGSDHCPVGLELA